MGSANEYDGKFVRDIVQSLKPFSIQSEKGFLFSHSCFSISTQDKLQQESTLARMILAIQIPFFKGMKEEKTENKEGLFH